MEQRVYSAVGGLTALLIAGAAFGQDGGPQINLLDTLDVSKVNRSADVVGQPSISFDLNGDGLDDFEIQIFTRDFIDERRRLSVVQEAESPGNPVGEHGDLLVSSFSERATISGLETEGTVGSVFVESRLRLEDTPVMEDQPIFEGEAFVALFEEGEAVTAESGLLASQGILYSEDFFDIADISLEPQVLSLEEGGIGFGPFAEFGSSGFIGLAVSTDEGAFFGWAEITRGSISIGQVGLQTLAGAGAPVAPLAAVPVPPALGLLGGALALLGFAARRRRKPA